MPVRVRNEVREVPRAPVRRWRRSKHEAQGHRGRLPGRTRQSPRRPRAEVCRTSNAIDRQASQLLRRGPRRRVSRLGRVQEGRDRKHHHGGGEVWSRFEFRPLAGFVFPIQTTGAAELTDAFWRRFIFNCYNRAYEGDKSRVLDFAKPIIANEIPGIVVYLIEGAARLLKQGKYTIPSSHYQEESKWKLAADTVRSFLEGQYTKSMFVEPRSQGYDPSGKPTGQPIKNHDWTGASDLYMDYRSWCEANGHRKPVASPEFKRRIEKIGYANEHTRHGNFYGVRPLQEAQGAENQRAKKSGEPPEMLKGAISSLVEKVSDTVELTEAKKPKIDKDLN